MFVVYRINVQFIFFPNYILNDFFFVFQARGKGAEAPNVNDEMSFPSLG